MAGYLKPKNNAAEKLHQKPGQEDKMKTPWSDLLQYGAGIAVFVVLLAAGLVFFAVVGIAVILAKLAVFIK